QDRRRLMAGEPGGEAYPAPIVDHNARPATIARLIALIIILALAALAFSLYREQLGDPLLLGMLGLLAMIGVGFLFSAAIGFVRIGPRGSAGELARSLIDTLPHGLVVSDSRGRIVYANRAWADLTGATSPADVKSVEALLGTNEEAAAVIMRISAGLRDGRPGEGEFRLSRPLAPGAPARPQWQRVRARLFSTPELR